MTVDTARAGRLVAWSLLAAWAAPAAAQQPLDVNARSAPTATVPDGITDVGRLSVFDDRDRDGIPSRVEIVLGLDPRNPADALLDLDGDTLSNVREVQLGTDPAREDSDGDGFADDVELLAGTDPLDPASSPASPPPALTGLAVAPSETVITMNPAFGLSTLRLRVTGAFDDGSSADLAAGATGTTYEVADPDLAEVSVDGVVMALQAGTTTITVRNGGFAADVSLQIESASPTRLSFLEIPGIARSVDVQSGIAYVAAGPAGLQVVDARDPRSPRLVGVSDTPGEAFDVKVVGNLAYVADGESGLRIIDVSDPTAPSQKGAVDTPGIAVDVAVRGTLAYVADHDAGLAIVDTSDPDLPQLIATVATPGAARGVDVNLVLGLAAVASGPETGVQLVDVSDPLDPRLRGSVPTRGGASDIAFSGIFAVVADGCGGRGEFGGTQVVDVSDPDVPVALGVNDLRFNACDVALLGNLALFAENFFTNAVPIVRLDDPNAPRFTASVNFQSFNGAPGTGIAVSDNLVYLTGARSRDSFLYIGRVRVFNDNGDVAPRVAVDDPGALREGEIASITVRSADDVTVNRVELLRDGLVVGEVETPGALEVFAVTVPLGATEVVLDARATDLAGNVGVAGSLSVLVVADTPPSVTIVEPALGAHAPEGSTVLVRAEALDDAGITSVRFLVDGTPIADLGAPPFEATFTAPLETRALDVEAIATDTLGQTSSGFRIVEVADLPPTVGLVLPFDGREVIAGRELVLQAMASDDIAVASVQLFDAADGGMAALSPPLTAAPYVASFPVPFDDGGRTLEVIAVVLDSGGQQSVSDTATVTVLPDEPPSVTLRAPAPGTTVIEGETLAIEASSTDDVGVQAVEFLVDGVSQATVPGAGDAAVEVLVPAGIDGLLARAVATDTSGQTSAAEVVVAVEPDPLTTVVGVVQDAEGNPIAGASVQVLGASTAPVASQADGLFAVPGIATIDGDVVVVASAAIAGADLQGSAPPAAPVPGGETDVGVVRLTAGSPLGMIVDDASNTVTVFDSTDESVLASLPLETTVVPDAFAGSCTISPDGATGYVATITDLFRVDLEADPPALAAGTNPIRALTMMNVNLTDDERYALGCAAVAFGPGAVVDLENQVQIGAGVPNCDHMDICADGSILVVEQTTDTFRRLVIDDDGNVTETGESITLFGGDNPENVDCAVGGGSAAVIGRAFLDTFHLPPITRRGTQSLSPGFLNGIDVLVHPLGDRIYTRYPGNQGSGEDIISAFAFDTTAGMLVSDEPLFAFAVTERSEDSRGRPIDFLALDPTGAKLYVPEPSTAGQPGAVGIYNASTGELLGTVTHPNIIEPTGVCFAQRR